MIKINCPVCTSENLKAVTNKLYECGQCSHRFISILEPKNYYKEIYNEDYFNGAVYENYRNEEKYRRNMFRKKINLIRKNLPKEGTVLDIGCGMGFFLKEMQLDGYEIRGIDISSYAAGIASDNLGIEIKTGDIVENSFNQNQFQIVTLWDVLEHTYNPAKTLSEMSRIMKNDGILIIETLNISSVLSKVLKEKWPLYFPPYHLQYFTKRSIVQLFKTTGLKIIKTFPIQTYIKTFNGYRSFHYFRFPVIRDLMGVFFNDVEIHILKKL